MKSIEAIQEAEQEAKELLAKAQAGRLRKIDSANAKAKTLVADAEIEAKTVMEGVQKREMQTVSSKRAMEGSEMRKISDRLAKRRLSKNKTRRIADKAMELIVGG